MNTKNFLIVVALGLAFVFFILALFTGDVEILDSVIHLTLIGYVLIAWRDIEKIQDRLTTVENQPRVDADDMAKRIATKIRELLRST